MSTTISESQIQRYIDEYETWEENGSNISDSMESHLLGNSEKHT